MRSYPNIDKSKFDYGTYIGYAHGVWKIRRYGSKDKTWRAHHTKDSAFGYVYGRVMAEISEQLQKIADARHPNGGCRHCDYRKSVHRRIYNPGTEEWEEQVTPCPVCTEVEHVTNPEMYRGMYPA